MDRRTLKMASLLLLSGLCALIYQTVWMREIRLVFGASTSASAAVIGIFMGGLGVGGWLFGRRAERSANPLQLYAHLELAISAAAAASPFLVTAVRALYILSGGSQSLGGLGATVVRLLLTVLVLGPTTVLMGGTLPAAARAVESAGDASRRRVAVLFGLNTFGAVVGVAVSTFLLLEVFGNRGTLWLACGVNALVGLTARAWSRRAEPPAPAATPPAEVVAAAAPARFVLAAAALVGFAFMLMELVWYRSLAPILGGSTYTMGLVLLTALLGIGLGGAAYAAWGVESRATLRGLAVTCALEALLIALPLALGDRIALAANVFRGLSWFGFDGLVASWGLITLFVVFPGALVSGYQFPLLIALLGRGEAQVGRQVGLAYAWNTLGSIAGSLAGGFGLIPLFSVLTTWRAAAITLALLGLAGAVLFVRRSGTPRAAALPAALLLGALLCSVTTGPTTFSRHSAIGAGRATMPSVVQLNALKAWVQAVRANLFWERDGIESTVGLSGGDGVSFLVNGKVDGHSFLDAGTQVMSMLIGAALHPQPKRALVIGLGTGSTAGWVAQVPSIERVDVAEIEPAILEVARVCADVNRHVLENPKVRVALGDARELLLASRDDYDLIFSEPSNPYRSGISSLYTREYYEAARARLGAHGLFLQWLQAYEVEPATVRTVLATIGSVFPEAEVWQTRGGDLLIMGSASPIPHDVGALRTRLAAEPFATAMRVSWQADDVEGFLAHFVGGTPLVHGLAQAFPGEVNTDDLNLVEFAFARSVGRSAALSLTSLFDAAQRSNSARPNVTGELDWSRVEEERLVNLEGYRGDAKRLSEDARQRFEFFSSNLPRPAKLLRFRSAPFEPKGIHERVLLATLLATEGAPEAEQHLEDLRATCPVEVAALTAELRYAQHRYGEAGEALLQSFAALRANVWSDRTVFMDALNRLPLALARRDPALGRRLYDALGEPFPVRAYDSMRRGVRVELASQLDFAQLCADALAAYEPFPTWSRELLAQRVRCSRATHSPLLARAEDDWKQFLDEEPSTLLDETPELAPATPAAHEEPEEDAPDASVAAP